MRIDGNGGLTRYFKVLWLPLVIVIMIAVEPYLGIADTPYEWAYLGFQVLLFIVYAYIIYRDRPHAPAARRLKGKRKAGKK